MCKEFIGRDSTPRHSGVAPEQILTAGITNYFGASFLGANAACTDGVSSRMCLIYAAIVHNSLSLFHFPLANIPVRRSPCFAIQKICEAWTAPHRNVHASQSRRFALRYIAYLSSPIA